MALRVQAASLTEDIQKLRSRSILAIASSAEHERTAQQRQMKLQRCRAAAAGKQELSDALQQRAGRCRTDLERAVEEVRAAEIAVRSASKAGSHHERAAIAAARTGTDALAAQAECTARLTASQQVLV